MVNNNIIKTIDTALASIVNIPIITKENTAYKPTLKVSYIRSTLLAAEPSQTTIGFDRTIRWGGLYQIDVFHPANTGSQSDIVDSIIKYFNTNRFIGDGTFQLTVTLCWRGTASTETDWYRIPVMLRYETYTTNETV